MQRLFGRNQERPLTARVWADDEELRQDQAVRDRIERVREQLAELERRRMARDQGRCE